MLVLALVAALACAPRAHAAVGHGNLSASVTRLAATVPPRGERPAAPTGTGPASALSALRGEAATWGGGIVAAEGARRLTAPVSSALARGLASVLPSGIARTAGTVLAELVTGAAFKVGMDEGESLASTGRLKRLDWLEVGASAAGMVIGGHLLRPFLGPIGEALGGWLGWSLGETLVRQYRRGEGLSLTKALGDMDVPRLALQALAAEGALAVAAPLVKQAFGLGGPLGIVAGVGAQIALTAGASYVANKIADGVFGSRRDDQDLPALEREARQAYERFVAASRGGGPGLRKALDEYRAAASRLQAARQGN